MTNKNKQAFALFLVVLMTVSACAVAGVTTSTKAQAATPTKTTLVAVSGKGLITFIRGDVKTSTGLAVGYGSVALYRQAPGETSRTYWKTVPVVSIKSPQPVGHKPGSFSVNDRLTKPGTVYYSAYYLGWPNTASQYATSWSGVKSVVVKYWTRVTGGRLVDLGRSVSGTLWYVPYSAGASKEEPFGNQDVYVYKKGINDRHWTWFKKAKTDTNGKWSVSTVGQPIKTEYAAWYKGDATHWPASSTHIL